jgi:hypothetical protein
LQIEAAIIAKCDLGGKSNRVRAAGTFLSIAQDTRSENLKSQLSKLKSQIKDHRQNVAAQGMPTTFAEPSGCGMPQCSRSTIK